MLKFQDDYYDILNIKPTSSNKEVIQAYRRLALKWHPDKNHADNAHHMFVKIAEAYEVLSDSTKRNKYDSYYFSANSRFESAKNEKTRENATNESDNSADGWVSSFKNPFDIFNNFFPELDIKVLKVFSKAVSHMKTVTNHEFLIKLMDEYRYFTKNKTYKYDVNEEEKGSPSNTNRDTFNEYRRRKTHDYLKRKYNAKININQSEYNKSRKHASNTINIPPKQIYELEISLVEYLQKGVKRINLPMLAKCFTCSIKRRDGCHICNGDLYYESIKIYPMPMNEYEVYFPEGGNFLPDCSRPCDLIVYCEDKFDKFYKRIGGFHLYAYVYWDGHNIIFRYIDGSYYRLDVYNKYKSDNPIESEHNKCLEPCDFTNNIIRIDNMGLPDHMDNQDKRGDLFIRFTQDCEYELDETNMKQANEYLKCHPENDIEPNEILRIDNILEHFT
jgi:DnaJ-class molecular chaperone